MPVTATVKPEWRRRADEAYAATQAKIPQDWRLSEDLLAPAWVYKDDIDPSDIQKDVRHVLQQFGILSELELAIVKMDCADILPRIASGEWSAVQVTTAFCKSAAVAQQLYRCCTELFFERALDRAAQLDEAFARTGKTVGVLHGLPISLKDQYELKGIRTTMGLSSMLDFVGKTDATIVQALESQGAVIFVKTNVPMSLMSADSVNAVWGRCVNPLDRTRTAGGSSGGEASLVSAFGSPLGIGSDIAASIRVPAAMCGIYGFKPTPGRLPLKGGIGCGSGAEFVLPVIGPIARSVNSLELFMQCVIAVEPWKHDAGCGRLPWTPITLDKPLRIGVIRDNGLVRPHPPIARALEETVDRLQKAGHTVVEWTVGEIHAQAHLLAKEFFRQDGGATLQSFLGDEPILSIVDSGCPESILTAPEILGKHWQSVGLRGEYLQRWHALELDAVICPVASHVATEHNDYNDISNTLPFNLLQYPAAVVPVSHVEASDMSITDEYRAYTPRPTQYTPGLNGDRGDKENHAMYLDERQRKGMLGLPICLQIVTPPHMDEHCLAVAHVVDQLMH